MSPPGSEADRAGTVRTASGRLWIALGSAFGLAAVALSALAAHAPWAAEPDMARLLGHALTMQGWHALALLATGLLAERRAGRLPDLAGLCFALGTALFAGAIWWIALNGTSPGPAAPVGGTLLMLGWVLLGVGALRR